MDRTRGTMLGARLYGRHDLRLERLPIPSPGEDEVLVRVGACGICGSDLHLYDGEDPWGTAPNGPRPLGHETAGAVAALGSGVTRCAPGDRVAIEPPFSIGCGRCRSCRLGRTNLCSGRDRLLGLGGFAEFLLAGAAQVHRVPDGLELAAAAFADVYACAIHALKRVPLRGVEAIAVVGTGALAVAIGQVARAAGVPRVLIVGRRSESTARAAAACGTGLALNFADVRDLESACREILGGTAPGIVFEAVGGDGASMQAALQAVAAGGTIAIVGAFWHSVTLPYALAHRKEVTVIFSNGYVHGPNRPDFARALDMMASRQVDPRPLVSRRFPLSGIGSAFEAAALRDSIRITVFP